MLCTLYSQFYMQKLQLTDDADECTGDCTVSWDVSVALAVSCYNSAPHTCK